jgi:hypothetical protein
VGYDLHISRRKNWSSEGRDIAAREWLAYVESDPELTLSKENGDHFALWSGPSKNPDPWLDWHDGNIHTKNPDEALIDKMIVIARALQAEVQGDDGEIYRSGHEPPYYRQPSLRDRFLSWLRSLRPAKPLTPIRPSFTVGDRMLDGFHRECTVIEIDPKAEHGLGKVVIRYDDGKVMTFALVASGLRPRENEAGRKA